MLTFFLALTVPVTAVAILHARWEYRKRGKLTLLGSLLLCAMLFVPNLVLEYATTYEMPSTPLDYIGVFVGVVGIVLCLISITLFQSVPKVMCMETGKLTISGPYRWSRNPQYVGWFLFLLGCAQRLVAVVFGRVAGGGDQLASTGSGGRGAPEWCVRRGVR